MTANIIFLCVILQGIIHIAADRTSFTVSQAPKEANVSRGDNMTFYCIFPLSKDQTWVRVLWWKHGENEYLRASTDKRKRFGMASRASGFLRLLGVTIQDAGIYHCTVIRQGEVRGNGTGSRLTVYAAPTPLAIVSGLSEGNSSPSLALNCETAAFYPENLTLTWYKNGVESAFGIKTSKIKNTEGLYEVSSTLVETQSVLSGTNYTCSVKHVSLLAPAVVTWTVWKSNRDIAHMPFYYSCLRYMVGGLAFLLLLIITGSHCAIEFEKNENNQSLQFWKYFCNDKYLTAGAKELSWFCESKRVAVTECHFPSHAQCVPDITK